MSEYGIEADAYEAIRAAFRSGSWGDQSRAMKAAFDALREAGAAEMRERAADAGSSPEHDSESPSYYCGYAEARDDIAEAIRALPLTEPKP